MKKKTGFTLIELLAVIIILAIIALIATPIVLNVVEDSRETARRSSISGYASGVRYAAYDSGFVLTGKYPEVNKEWAEANVQTSGDKVECEEVRYSSTYETVLHKCRVGKSEKEYYFAGGKIYEDPEDAEYKAIYNSLPKEEKPNLAQELLEQYNESNTVGLLKDETGYYYKGSNTEVANNFLWFGGHLWRVISIDNDNNLTMITQQPITSLYGEITTADELNYEDSQINKWLNSTFLESLSENDKVKILGNAESLNLEQYTKAGKNNSFLNISDWFWLRDIGTDEVPGLTMSSVFDDIIAQPMFSIPTPPALPGPVTTTIKLISYVSPNGFASSSAYSLTYLEFHFGIRPVIKVSNLVFSEGEGTISNPYREKSKTTSTANIKVGEYISVPTSGNDCGEDKRCLFRVVSKDNDSIKVILNGLLSSTSAYGSSATYTSGNTIDIALNQFANKIDNKYRYTNSKMFNIGNYTSTPNATYEGQVGLPIMGEMFGGNDIDVGTISKTFVNANTIENDTISSYFWNMQGKSIISSERLSSVSDEYPDYISDYTSQGGVRPVLFLKNNLTFTSGDGTAESPFMLGE